MSLKACTVFTTGKESFEIADDEVEIGQEYMENLELIVKKMAQLMNLLKNY